MIVWVGSTWGGGLPYKLFIGKTHACLRISFTPPKHKKSQGYMIEVGEIQSRVAKLEIGFEDPASVCSLVARPPSVLIVE